MKSLLFLVAAVFLLPASQGLSFKVFDTEDRCFTVRGEAGQYLHFSYMCRGGAGGEDNVSLRSLNGEGDLETNYEKKRELDIVEKFSSSQTITLCLRSHDERTKTFNFFYEVRSD